jgi:hypothetical protein
MRNYHVKLQDNTERNIRADTLQIIDGALVLKNGPEVIVAYAGDIWAMVEVERKDDKGE